MPVIAFFDGIKLDMYFNDHAPPHIHAKYAEYEALITIQEATVYVGSLPSKQLKSVLNYVLTNQAELIARWQQYNPK